jgi:RimJ/RimL family protein N-acetyltransferase
MVTYKVLTKQVFTEGNYSILPIRIEDRYAIMKWRNEQLYHLRQTKPLTTEDQDYYFENVVTKLFEQPQPEQLLFSYMEGNTCIGYGGLVHINWTDRNAEISFIMDTAREAKEFQKHWGIYLGLIEQVAFDELGLHKIYTYAFDLRAHLYEALEANGYKREAVLKEHCYYRDKFYDVVIHAKWSFTRLTYRSVTENDVSLLFDWANDPDVRSNSINTGSIEWDSHVIWFSHRVKSNDTMIILAELEGKPIGQVRLEQNNVSWLIDYSVAKAYRGKGYGKQMLENMLNTFTDKQFVAYVKPTNIPSKKVFEALGFRVEGTEVKQNVELIKFVR